MWTYLPEVHCLYLTTFGKAASPIQPILRFSSKRKNVIKLPDNLFKLFPHKTITSEEKEGIRSSSSSHATAIINLNISTSMHNSCRLHFKPN